nr:MAG TPA: hypothetical protein [Caudoviricetes sp.]
MIVYALLKGYFMQKKDEYLFIGTHPFLIIIL